MAPPLRILIRVDRARNCFTDPAAHHVVSILEAAPANCPRGTLLLIHQYDIDGDGGLLSSSGAFAANTHSAAAPQIGYGGGGGFAANRQPASHGAADWRRRPQRLRSQRVPRANGAGRWQVRRPRRPFVSNGWARGSASLQPGGDARWAAQSQLRGSRSMPPQLPQDPHRRQWSSPNGPCWEEIGLFNGAAGMLVATATGRCEV